MIITKKDRIKQLRIDGKNTSEQRQRREILRFLNGDYTKELDAFQIYQWIERCHFQKWWDLGISLANHIPPNTVDTNYQKRLDFLLMECRRNVKKQPIATELVASSGLMQASSAFIDSSQSAIINLQGKEKFKRVWNDCDPNIQNLLIKIVQAVSPLRIQHYATDKPDYRFVKKKIFASLYYFEDRPRYR